MVNVYAKVLGFLLLFIGVCGLMPVLTPNQLLFGIFHVDNGHSIFHLLSGLMLTLVAYTANWEVTRRVTLFIAGVYGTLTVAGFLAPEDAMIGMPMNMADNVLHLSIATTALMFGLPAHYPIGRSYK